MKKLMTMLAAVATAFGLYAADTGFISGAGFDTSDTANPTDTSYYTWLYNTETSTGDFVTGFWTGTDKASIVVDTYICAGGHPLQFDDKSHNRDQYLKIESGTDLVSQRILPGSAKKSIGDDGLYFDGLVQFTSFEDAPAIDDDAKIAVFPMVDDPDADTPVSHLIIKAFGTETNLWTTTETMTDDAWRRVTIKMIKNIMKTGTPRVGFVVYLDGSETPVRFSSENDSPFNNADLTPEAAYFNDLNALFGSLIEETAEITDVAFGGKGAIDEIAFTENAPSFAGSPKFAWIKGAEHIASFAYSTETWEAGDDALIVQLPIGETTGTAAVSNIKAEDGYFVTTKAYDVDVTAGETNTVGVATKLGATVVIGDVTNFYASATAALADINTTMYQDPVTVDLALNDDSGAIELNNANVTLTLDLAGNEIKSTVAETPAINVTAGALTIIDSSGLQTGVVAGVEGGGKYSKSVYVLSDTASLTIEAGTFNGFVDTDARDVDGTTTTIHDGLFDVASNANEESGDCNILAKIPAGAEWAQKNGYFYLKTVTDFTVEVPEKKANTTLEVSIGGVAAGDTNGVYTVAKASTLKAVYTADEGYELVGQGEWTVTYATKDTVTIVAPTAEQIMVDFTVADVTGATLLAVSNGTEEVIADQQGKYTVPTNATVVLYYEAKPGYRLGETTAEVKIDTADQVVDVSSTIKPAQITYVAQIGDDPTKKYETLAEAFTALQTGETIKLLQAYTAADDEVLTFNASGTLDLGGYKLMLPYALLTAQKFGAAANVTATLQNGEIEYLKGYNNESKLVGSSYGFKVAGGAVLNANCKITRPETGPAFDIYGGTVNCGANTEIDAGADIFRFKDNNLTSYVNISGGKFKDSSTGASASVFHLYKAGHTANIAITGGEFNYAGWLIDAYAEVKDGTGEAAGTKVTNAPPVLVFTKLDANNAARFSKQVLVAPQGTTIIEDKDLLAADCKVVVDTEKEGWFKVAEIQYATLAVDADAGITYVLTNKTTEAVVEAGYRADIDNAEVIEAIELGFAEGYELNAAASTTSVTLDAAETKTIVLKKQATEYTITYTTGNGTEVTNGVFKYTIATETFNLPGAADIDMKAVTGVEFAGWTNATSEAVVTEVKKGTTGNLVFFAKWTAVVPEQKVEPGEEKKYNTPKEAEDAAKNINDHKDTMIKVPTEAEATKAAYLERVAAKVKADGVTVVVDIAEAAEATFKGELDTEIKKADVAAALTDATATEVTITTVAGFYYWVEGGVEVGTINTNGKAEIGNGETKALTKPTLEAAATAGKAFYKLAVGVKDPASTPIE